MFFFFIFLCFWVLIFDFLTSLEEDTDLEFNKLSYEKEENVTSEYFLSKKSKLDKKYPAAQKGGRIKVAGDGMAIGHLRLTFELLRDKLIINEKR